MNYIEHDASASLIRDGEVIASICEERFVREKKYRNFPFKAIEYCLDYGGISLEDLIAITYYMDPEQHFKERVIDHLGKYYPKSVSLFNDMLNRALKVNNVEKEIRENLNYLGKVYFCNYHKAHIASSFFLSKFSDAAIISIDGLGEITSTVIASAEGNNIDIIKEINFPHSVGMLYNAVTHFLGFNAISNAGKVMGSASYGDPKKYIDDFRKLVKFNKEGGYEFYLDYFDYPFKRDTWVSEKFIELFGEKRNSEE